MIQEKKLDYSHLVITQLDLKNKGKSKIKDLDRVSMNNPKIS